MRLHEEDGGIISGWLLQLVVIVALVAFIGFEGIAIAIAHLSLDEDARQVAAAARNAYGGARDMEDAVDAGRSAAEELGIDVLEVVEVEDPPEVVFDLQKQAATLLLHRVGFFEGMTEARTSRRVQLQL